jgi:ABC-type multidrug transport system fused ATPase/permease subunit
LKIQESIENLKGRVPVFIIAHRLSTIMNCDKVLALENGKIIEEGEPRKLMEDKKSYFYRLYNTNQTIL